uniref:Uncharacterized protein n=1 Tax=Cannabis sativa TaxID=3483 RepID=A0A803NU92_CANSA
MTHTSLSYYRSSIEEPILKSTMTIPDLLVANPDLLGLELALLLGVGQGVRAAKAATEPPPMTAMVCHLRQQREEEWRPTVW